MNHHSSVVSSRATSWLRRGALSSALTVFVLFGAGSAEAQMATVSQRGDNGIRVGAGRLHPIFGFETRYDTYVGLSEEGGTTSSGAPAGTGDLILHIRPGLELQVPSEIVQLGARFLLDYNAYTGTTEAWTSDLSRTTAAFDLNALVNPNGRVQLGLDERFARSDKITNLELGALTLSNRNDLGVHLSILPGGGSFLLKPTYVNTYEHFEPRDGNPNQNVSDHDYWQHTPGLSLGYKLLPESALVLDASVAMRSYERQASEQFDTDNLRVLGGFVGMVAPRISILAKAGYGKQLDSAGYDGFLAHAEIGYLYSEETQIRLGYARTFEPSPSVGLYYTDDRVYLDGSSRLGRQLLLNAGVSYDQIQFPELTGRGTEDQIGFHIGPDWEFNSFLTAGISYALTSRTSARAVGGLDYDRHEVGAHVMIYY